MKRFDHQSKFRNSFNSTSLKMGLILVNIFNDFPQRFIFLTCKKHHFVHRSISYASHGIIDDSFERFFFIGVDCSLQISKQIFDFFARIKRKPTIDNIGNISSSKGFLKRPRLIIGSIQNSNIFKFDLLCIAEHKNLIGYLFALVIVRESTQNFDFVTVAIFGPNGFFNLIFIVFDQFVCGFYNGFGTSIILF